MEALLDIVKEEVAIYRSKEEIIRPTFELREMSAIEAYRFREKREGLINDRIKDQAKRKQKVHEYRMNLTHNIMENAPDIGVTGKC